MKISQNGYLSKRNNYIICGWSISDYNLIKENINLYNTPLSFVDNLSFLNNYCNIQEQLSIINNFENNLSLSHALEFLNISSNGQKHRALNDAVNASKIFKNIYNQIKTLEICPNCLKTHDVNKKCYNIDISRINNKQKEKFDYILTKLKPNIPYSHSALLKQDFNFSDIRLFVKYANLKILKKKHGYPILFGFNISNYNEEDILNKI